MKGLSFILSLCLFMELMSNTSTYGHCKNVLSSVKYIHTATGHIFPEESFGLAALEAMSMGVPVVSSNSGGIPEVNKHEFSGFLSDVGDVKDMSKNLIHMLSADHLETFRSNALNQFRYFII